MKTLFLVLTILLTVQSINVIACDFGQENPVLKATMWQRSGKVKGHTYIRLRCKNNKKQNIYFENGHTLIKWLKQVKSTKSNKHYLAQLLAIKNILNSPLQNRSLFSGNFAHTDSFQESQAPTSGSYDELVSFAIENGWKTPAVKGLIGNKVLAINSVGGLLTDEDTAQLKQIEEKTEEKVVEKLVATSIEPVAKTTPQPTPMATPVYKAKPKPVYIPTNPNLNVCKGNERERKSNLVVKQTLLQNHKYVAAEVNKFISYLDSQIHRYSTLVGETAEEVEIHELSGRIFVNNSLMKRPQSLFDILYRRAKNSKLCIGESDREKCLKKKIEYDAFYQAALNLALTARKQNRPYENRMNDLINSVASKKLPKSSGKTPKNISLLAKGRKFKNSINASIAQLYDINHTFIGVPELESNFLAANAAIITDVIMLANPNNATELDLKMLRFRYGLRPDWGNNQRGDSFRPGVRRQLEEDNSNSSAKMSKSYTQKADNLAQKSIGCFRL